MNKYLNEYIETLSTRQQEAVASLFTRALLDKQSTSQALERLEEDFLSIVSSEEVDSESIIQSSVMQDMFSQVSTQINEMYTVSNLISDLLATHASLLDSEVKELSSKVASMESTVNNLSFLMSNTESFDFGYLESFEDELLRERFDWEIPDRSGSHFTVENQASVNVEESALILPDRFSRIYGLHASKIDSNADSHKLYEDSLQNSISSNAKNGWRCTIATPGVVNAGLHGARDRSGVQYILEYRLEQPSVCSFVQIQPSSNTPLELVQVSLFESDDNNENKLLSTPRKIGQSSILHFPVQSVLRFRVHINQPTYLHLQNKENKTELDYRKMTNDFADRSRRNQQTLSPEQRSIYQRVFEEDNFVTPLNIPSPSSINSKKGPIADLDLIVRYLYNDLWRNKNSGFSSAAIYESMLKSQTPNLDRAKLDHRALRSADEKTALVLESDQNQKVDLNGRDYIYDLGISKVRVGLETPKYKGVYITKPLPSSGDIVELRLKADYENVESNLSRDDKFVTSIEFSVSNKALPKEENDWVPILPIDDDKIDSERLLVQSNGQANLRFSAAPDQSLTVYRNGIRIINGIKYDYDSSGRINKLFIDRSVYNPEDIFTCSYYPDLRNRTVNFIDLGFKDATRTFAYDSQAPGESFERTGNLNRITLSNTPYIDYEELDNDQYQPVLVELSDGTNAINTTTYDNNEIITDADITFKHVGDTLQFSHKITEPFKVYYEYLENNIRLRAVLRCNDTNFSTPKVSSMHLKAKTRRSN